MDEPNLFLWKLFCETFDLVVPTHTIGEDNIKNTIPNENIFGIFVTITRDGDNVHGCIGYIDQKLHRLSKDEIQAHGIDVAYSATFKDIRRRNFSLSISRDPSAEISASFMLLPVSKNIFDNDSNDEYGLICQNNNRMTTYLPNVWPGKKLLNIQNNLKIKAQANQCENWYKYRVNYKKDNFFNLMMYTLKNGVWNLEYFIDQYFSKYDFIFYSVRRDGTFKIEKNKRQLIRNLACIELLKKLKLKKKTVGKLDACIVFYQEIMNNNQWNYGIQNKIAMGQNLLKRNIFLNNGVKKDICDSDVYKIITDVEFTLGQYGIFYADYCILELKKKLAELQKMKRKIDAIVAESSYNYREVFKINWFSQFLFHFLLFVTKTPNNDDINNINKKEIIIKELYILWNDITEILFAIVNKTSFVDQETNFLAVAFESLCFLKKALIYFEKKLINNSYNNKKQRKIKQTIFYLFLHLEKRKFQNTDFCLYSFLDGTSRLDISCHIFNGILHLIS
jgi:AMMECR1 domain-containing protein